MTIETPFGTSADDATPFDSDGSCACGARADLDGTTCVECFNDRWAFDSFTAPSIPTPLAA